MLLPRSLGLAEFIFILSKTNNYCKASHLKHQGPDPFPIWPPPSWTSFLSLSGEQTLCQTQNSLWTSDNVTSTRSFHFSTSLQGWLDLLLYKLQHQIQRNIHHRGGLNSPRLRRIITHTVWLLGKEMADFTGIKYSCSYQSLHDFPCLPPGVK